MSILNILKQKKEELDQLMENSLELAVKDIFDSMPEFNGFVVIGYTPGFNDGEPCEHTGIILLNDMEYDNNYNCFTSDLPDNGYEFEEGGEIVEFFEVVTDENTKSFSHINDQMSKAQFRELEKNFEIIDMLFSKSYGTDYLVKVKRDPSAKNGVSMVNEYYDCGY
jgi:hypothetical protein